SSQRARQFGGAPTLNKNWRIYNCVTSYCDRTSFFPEAFWLLLCGCGVGFSVQTHHIASIPPLLPKTDWSGLVKENHVIPDTIEGWADALRTLIDARVGLRGTRPVFDYSEIRPKGAPLSVGGKAPGPEPLKICLERVENLLSTREGKLSSVDCFDIVMFASDAVLSGGVRRAASIALFSADDEAMVTAKTGNWYVDNPQRARANISAVITPNTSRETYDAIFESTKQFGEPGFIFSESTEYLYNPCVEIGMAPVLITDEFGDVVSRYTVDMLEDREHYKSAGYEYESGWQACNLVEVNCSAFKSEDDALEAVQHATVLATAQAGYTQSDYLPTVSERILQREALIGVSLTGMANTPQISFDATWQNAAADLVKRTNKRVAQLVGVNPASRTTCVKPSGNAAVLLGCASGVHAEYARRYIRNVQVSADNPVAQYFSKIMPDAVQKSAWSAPGTEDVVISFPIDNMADDTLYRKDLTAEAFIDLIKTTQVNWVQGGTREDQGVEGLTHNVSNTILVKDDEWGGVQDRLWAERDTLSGVSLLGLFGDYVYEQPPFQEIVEDPETEDAFYEKKLNAFKRWTHLRDNWTVPNYTRLLEKEDNTLLLQEASCVGGTCEFKPVQQ
ncbi:MAG: recombinase, partial [Chlamydiota bacterium]|nr:recombinase [Chlamydiota bacterium]